MKPTGAPSDKGVAAGKLPVSGGGETSEDLRSWMAEHDSDTPSDNVYAIAAWWYSQYGITPLDRATIEDFARELGVIIPKRSDATLRTGTHENKNKFVPKDGGYKPTITGEKWLRETYGVRKGARPPPERESG